MLHRWKNYRSLLYLMMQISFWTHHLLILYLVTIKSQMLLTYMHSLLINKIPFLVNVIEMMMTSLKNMRFI